MEKDHKSSRSPINKSANQDDILQNDLRRTIMTEAILFLVIGATSFLSLIFLSSEMLAYLIGAICYGTIHIFCGSIGLYGSYKVSIPAVLIYLVTLIIIALFNLLAIVACIILLISLLISGEPSCSQTCGLSKFVFYVTILYYSLQSMVAVVLLVYSCISFKHSRIFYLKEKRFAS